MKTSASLFRQLAKIISLSVLLTTPMVFAASTDTWVGSAVTAGNYNFSTTANWSYSSGSGPVASSGDTLSFAGNGSTSPNNDMSGASFAAINFTSAAQTYTIGGNSFTLAGNVANSSANLQTINCAIAMTAVRTFTMTTGGGDITLGGNLSGTGGGITTAGTGTLTVSGNNAHTGANTVNSAGSILKLGSTTALGTGSISVSGGTLDFNGFAINNAVPDKAINGGTLKNTGAAVVLTGMGTISASAGRTIILDGTGDMTFGQAINSLYSINKNGANKVTLSGANTYANGTTINAGVVNAGIAQNGTTSGPLGKSGNIVFGGGTLQFSAASASWDPSTRINSGASSGAIKIDPNGQNITFATALNVSQTGGLTVNDTAVTKGKLTLSGANVYTGITTITAGILSLASGATLTGSSSISVASGATLDVSAISFTLGSSQSLQGSGTVHGAVTTSASANSAIYGGGSGTVGTLTFDNTLNMSAGGSAYFDLTTSASSGNDKVLANNLTLSSSDSIHISAISGVANLDTTADYILFVVTNTPTMSTTPTLVFDGTQPGNNANFVVQKIGTNIVLHYNAVSSPTVTASVTPTTALRNQSVTINATVTPGSGTVTNVSVNLSGIDGPASQTMIDSGDHIHYSWTTNVAAAAAVGTPTLTVTVTDTTPLTGAATPTLTVNTSTETWNGAAVNNNWSSGANWMSTFAPGLIGDSLVFAGTTRLTPSMDNSYSVNSLIFNSTAGSFTIGTANSSTLTLNGTGVTNGSTSLQTINCPIAMTSVQIFNMTTGGGDMTLGGNISGTGGGITTAGTGTLTVSGNNSQTGANTINSGTTVKLGSTTALGINTGTSAQIAITAGTLDFNGFAINNPFANKGLDNAVLKNTGAAVDLTAMGDITLGSASRTFSLDGTGDMTLGQAITHTGSGGYTVIKNGANTVTFSGSTANSLAGLTVNSGTLMLAKTNVNSANTSFTINGGTVQLGGSGGDQIANGATVTVASGGVFDLNGQNETIGGLNLAGTGISNGGALINNGTNTSMLTGTVTLTADASMGGSANITLASAVGGTGFSLIKTGNGTLTLSGANNYTGNSIINAGSLALTGSGSIAATPLISVTNGAVFDVSSLSSAFALGTIQTLSNNAAATGTLNGNLNTSNGTVAVSFLAGTPSFIVTNGTLTLSNLTIFKINNTGAAFAAGSYKIIAKATAGNVGILAGTLPSVNVTGGGFAVGTVASLQIISGELFLVVTHPPAATTMTVTRSAGLSVKISLSDLATNWTDSDGDTVVFSGINLVTTNLVNLATNGTWILYTNSPNVSDQFSYGISDGKGGTNIGLVNIVIMSNITGQTTGLISPGGVPVTVSFAGIPGYSYSVQRATNLTDWVTIWTTNAPSGGLFDYPDYFTELGGTAPTSAYYRLRWNP